MDPEDEAPATPATPAKRPRQEDERYGGPDSGTRNVFEALLHRPRGFCEAHRLRRGTWYAPRLQIEQDLERHEGCVNCLAWSRDGSLLASGSDDTCLCIWSYNLRMRLKLCLRTGHAANIFGVAFLANEPLVCTCSVDGTVRLMDITAERCASVWRAHTRGANKVVTTFEEPNVVTSCGGDGKVRQHDRRVRRPDLLLDWDLRWDGARLGVFGAEINSMTSCLLRPELLALAGDDPFLWLYDRRMLAGCEPLSIFRPDNLPLAPSASVTGVALSPDGRRLLGSWQRQDVYQFSSDEGQSRPSLTSLMGQKPGRRHGWTPEITANSEGSDAQRGRFVGHSNIRTIKEVAYLGPEAALVASGSDCGHLFVWDARTAELLLLRRGDHYVVNAIATHPRDLCLATSGIDTTVKIWMPNREEAMPLDLANFPWVKEIIRANQTRRHMAETDVHVMENVFGDFEFPNFDEDDLISSMNSSPSEEDQ